MKRQKKFTLVAVVGAGVLAAGLLAQPALSPLPVAQAENTAAQRVVGLPDFTELVAATSPAVVNISAVREKSAGTRPGNGPRFGPDEEMPEFFRRFGPPMPDGEGPSQRSGGSGFIISSDGTVLTNAHVVAGADEVEVRLNDKRQFKAKVVGADKVTDVALLKIDAKGLPTLKVGDAKALRVGEWVIAIGSPFGFDNTVSAGVVSAKMRSLPNGSYVPFIQTDVAINPGNSGGPLLNLKGEVVGINSQIYSQSGGYMGLSFAIPMDLAMDVQGQLANGGKVQRGRLGVSVQSLDQELARSFGLEDPRGALVSQVQDDTPAAKAGIKAGDVILKVDGETVEDSAMLSRVIAGKKPGQRVDVDFLRNGKRQSREVALADMAGALVATSDESGDGTAQAGRLGVAVQPLDEDARRAMGDERGVVVTAVKGPAAKAGLRPGDVILAVNATPVTSPGELQQIIAKAGERVALLVQRDDSEIYVPVKLG